MITKSKLVVIPDSSKLTTIVFNVLLQTFSIQSISDVDHAQLITYTTTPPSNATVESHVLFQDNLTPTTFANVQLIKKVTRESGIKVETHATVQPIFHSGMVNIVLLAHQILNSIQKKNNAITAQKDSSEITAVTPVSQDNDQVYTFIVILFIFLLIFQQINNWSQKIFKFISIIKKNTIKTYV
jgi:hypothetical protein